MKPQFDPRKAHEKGDTLPEQANVYVPPRPLAQISDHRTMDIKAIRIAAEIDPRQAKTIVRMQAPPRRRRGLVLFAVSSVVIIGLLAAAAYVTIVGPEPQPLDSEATPVAQPPALLQPAPAPLPPRTATSQPLGAPTEPANAAAPAVTLPATTSAPRTTSRPAHAAPHKAKPSREPWLE